ncbi:prepilin peptidase [Curtobacterium sp. RHCKG23]|uniref:Prepilin peptidase n=1 Tax=Curtobacterium citri TaxID=3055139 RepID=A0ABT7T4V7_9MICO|nr:A24 family peptidase [Curtobacterium citri]MDM7884565.1 prepilin peptidase [Curtobacterium citri]
MGLLVGSFLNVVVHRVPAGISVVRPPSACPGCGHEIRGFDNVPVLSWIALRGRCRDCRAPISARYPAVELATAVLFTVVAVVFVPTITDGGSSAGGAGLLLALLYLMAISVALALIDIDTHRLPNVIVLPAYVVVVVLLGGASAVTGDWGAFVRAGIGLVGLGTVYLVLALAVPGGMGMGDVKLAGVLGFVLAYLGWGPLAVGAFAAFLLGGTFSLVLMSTGRAGRRSGIPFGPWMLAGAWLGIFLGPVIWAAYLGALGLG